MKNQTSTPAIKSWPRLLAEPETSSTAQTGYLQLHSTSRKIEIGDTVGREFRLLQCLFSAQNFISAKYAPVTQTYERLYLAIKTSGDSLNEKLSNLKSADREMISIVRAALFVLETGAAGKYLTFVDVGDKLRMEIAGAVPA